MDAKMIKASVKRNIFWAFLVWHFVDAPKSISQIIKNYAVFYWNYFSIPLLLKTLFSPWRKTVDIYNKGFDLKRFFEAMAGNFISRLLGAIVRLFTIILGLLLEILTIILGIFLLIIWYLWPIISIFGTIIAISLLI